MNREYNPERCDWHEEQMRSAGQRLDRLERSIYTQNGEPGLIETVRAIAKVQRWQSIALLVLLMLQLQQPARELIIQLLRKMVTP